jgi:hypothetical protein
MPDFLCRDAGILWTNWTWKVRNRYFLILKKYTNISLFFFRFPDSLDDPAFSWSGKCFLGDFSCVMVVWNNINTFFFIFLGFRLSLLVERDSKCYLGGCNCIMALWNIINAFFFIFLGFRLSLLVKTTVSVIWVYNGVMKQYLTPFFLFRWNSKCKGGYF